VVERDLRIIRRRVRKKCKIGIKSRRMVSESGRRNKGKTGGGADHV
jgi:hypothetical protein